MTQQRTDPCATTLFSEEPLIPFLDSGIVATGYYNSITISDYSQSLIVVLYNINEKRSIYSRPNYCL